MSVFLVLWCAVTATAQDTGVLVGTVRTPAGTPVTDIVLTFTGQDTVVSARTDADGNYRLTGLTEGRYSFTLDGTPGVPDPGFPVSVVAGITIRRDLTLLTQADSLARARGGDRLVEVGHGLSAVVTDLEAVETRSGSFATFLQDVPGISVSRAGGVGRPTTVRVRGAPATDRFLITDGLPFGGFYTALDTYAHREWGRFETVRGLPSSRHGSELAGSAQRLTRLAGDQRAARVAGGIELGDYGWQQIEANATGRSGIFDWSFGAEDLQTDNDQPNSAFSRTGASGVFGMTRETVSVDLEFRGETATIGSPGPSLFLPVDLDAGEERTQWMSGVTLGWQQSRRTKHEMRLVASQTERLDLNPTDSGLASLFPVNHVGVQLDVPDFAQAMGLRHDTRTATLVYEYNFAADEFHTLMFGGGVEGRSGRFGTETEFDQRRMNLVAYGEDRMQVFDNLTVTGGGRVEKSGPYAVVGMPRASARYELRPGVFLHGSGGMAAVAPTLGQRFEDTFQLRGNPDLRLSRSSSFDGGLSAVFWEERARADITGYKHDYEDLIVLGNVVIPEIDSLPAFRRLTLAERRQFLLDAENGLAQPFPTTATFDQARVGYTNLPDSRTYGVEATFSLTPIPQFDVVAIYTFTDSLVIEGTELILPGHSLPGVPNHQSALLADFSWGPVSVGATMRYVGRRPPDVDLVSQAFGVDAVAAYTRWDARTQLRVGRQLSLSVVAENMTDEQYQDVLGYSALGRLVRAGLHVGF